MSDIVKRLRDASLDPQELRLGWLAEAIDEIERLRSLEAHYLSVAAENRPSRALHEAALAERDAEIERLRAVIAGYENGISWNTTKLSDAERLDAHAEGYFSRQKEVDDLKETIRRLENECYKKCGVCEFDYGRAAPPIARSGESG